MLGADVRGTGERSRGHATWPVAAIVVGSVLVGCGHGAARPDPSGSVPGSASATDIYHGQLRRVCLIAAEKSLRDRSTATDGVKIESIVAVESDELDMVKQLTAPPELAIVHNEIIEVLGDRVAKLRGIGDGAAQMDKQQVSSAIAEADALSHRLDVLFRTIGVDECMT